MEQLRMHSKNIVQDHLSYIKNKFPNCIKESIDHHGQIKLSVDFDELKQELSETIIEGAQERYTINWPGKREALTIANSTIIKTLRPYKDESVSFDTTKNLFIEGDNLEILKLLQESYLNKIKLIYIDPPYNTGHDFIYKDDFSQDINTYLLKSKQINQKSLKMSTNTEFNGRFHSNWLSMIYPRLKLAKNLLRNDGAIFVSIGVEELANLKKVMDELFGEDNFIEIFSWVKTSTPPALSTKSRKTNEYILCYEKNKNAIKYNGDSLDGGDQPLLNSGNSTRVLKFKKELVCFSFIKNGEIKSGKVDRVSLLDDINIENNYSISDFSLKGEFKWTQDFLNEEIKKGTKFIIKSDKLSIRFIRTEEGHKRPTNFIKDIYTTPIIDKKQSHVETNEKASSDLKNLMNTEIFTYPKPVSLIKYLISFILEENDVVMDFFAGSGTTAEALIEWCFEHKKKARYILAQLPENLDDSLNKITDPNAKKMIENAIHLLNEKRKALLLTELTKERICRAIDKFQLKKTEYLDLGFRVLKVDSSNMNDTYYTINNIKQQRLFNDIENIKKDRSAEDLLFQVLLDLGIELSAKIEQKMIQEKKVFFVENNSLLACFDNGMTEILVLELAQEKPLRIVFKDSAFASDQVKINISQIFKQYSPETEVKTI